MKIEDFIGASPEFVPERHLEGGVAIVRGSAGRFGTPFAIAQATYRKL